MSALIEVVVRRLHGLHISSNGGGACQTVPRVSLVLAILAAAAGLACGGADVDVRPFTSADPRFARIDLSLDETYQVMSGWEATAQAGQGFERYGEWRDDLLDRAVEDLGINRLRVAVRASAESDRDHWRLLRGGTLSQQEWRCVRYSTVNDNADPDSTDLSRFHFSELDHTVENVVLPMRERLERRGEQLFVNVNYTAFTGQICDGLGYHHADPEEYAEFALAVLEHLDRKYDLHVDAWELVLEPDNTEEWTGRALGEALVATQRRLEAAGYAPEFIAPSTTSMAAAVPFVEEMTTAPGAAALIDEVSYHRYRGVSRENLVAVAERAGGLGARTAMLEYVGADHIDLHEDLTVGNASAWQQFTLGFTAPDNGAQYFQVDTVARPATVQIGTRTPFLARYFRNARMGATRIGATSESRRLEPAAFVNKDGSVAVVLLAARGSQFSVVGLPAGEYSVVYTTESEPERAAGTVALKAGQALNAGIPRAGVVSIARLRDSSGSPR